MTDLKKPRRARITRAKALELFRAHGGILRSRNARALGIHPATLARLRDEQQIKPLAPGLYCLADMPPLTQPDLIAVSRKIPQAVICLVSALALHGLTDEVPHTVDCALPRNARSPRLAYPPLRVFRFSPPVFNAGVEVQTFDGQAVRVYGPEKTLADCFKYRHKLGLDTVLEALRRYRSKYGLRAESLLRYARLCRVHNVMRPYLEASL